MAIILGVKISHWFSAIARAVRWHRRKLAALSAVLCVLTMGAALRPPVDEGIDLLVTARAVDAGATLEASDLRLVRVPSGLTPQGHLSDPSPLVGRVVAAPLPRGLPVTEFSVVSAHEGVGKGELLVPVKVQDASMLSLVRAGDRVTVVAAGQDGAAVTLAERVRVASVPAASEGSGGGTILVACEKAVSARLAAWASGGPLGIALG